MPTDRSAGLKRLLGTGERSLESLALAAGAVSFAAVGLIAIPVFGLGDAPISGRGSIGEYAAVASGVVAIVVFAAGRAIVAGREGGGRMRPMDVLDVVALAIAHGVIALLTWTLLADILERAFIGAPVFAVPLLVIAGSAGAVTAYVVFSSATHMDLLLLAIVLAVFLVEGMLASMLTASDPHWWAEHLSALGMTDDLSARAFNLTLIVAGFLVTTLARAATTTVTTSHPHGRRNVRVCLVLIGVLLACVGIFPVDTHFWIHTVAASGMAVTFFVLVVALRRWIPGTSRTFLVVGWSFMAVVVLLAVYFIVGLYTLTAVELVAGILVFTWIILFIRNVAALGADARPSGTAGAVPEARLQPR
ncbi:DUF998 domain-containing protein [Agromyces kandeliae]|uniref:DUF998 domain-containing protein n=1 Tax=Agromyces kandeliae TaxID=2666141 RepID=A0A6L5R5L1_9MICO|nr:DUF998 domain-containing protein [Agromyces kandeliae]MRX44854.1 DUF998 domain-containing protein [Agromyces kandeliae]